jgi:hypothetical protein
MKNNNGTQKWKATMGYNNENKIGNNNETEKLKTTMKDKNGTK